MQVKGPTRMERGTVQAGRAAYDWNHEPLGRAQRHGAVIAACYDLESPGDWKETSEAPGFPEIQR